MRLKFCGWTVDEDDCLDEEDRLEDRLEDRVDVIFIFALEGILKSLFILMYDETIMIDILDRGL
jgi:hypothetical protein